MVAAGCPSDFISFSSGSATSVRIVKQAVVTIDKNLWYQLRVVASGDHFACYAGKKMVLDVVD